jgi:hypothetical protein
MTPKEVRDSRETLGRKWGLGRPLRAAELARLLGLRGRHAGASVLAWEDGRETVSGPASLAIWYMIHSHQLPPSFDEAVGPIGGKSNGR